MTGPTTKGCSVYLTGAALARQTVSLSSNNAAVTVPATVTVAAGASSAGFSATVASVKTTQIATLTAVSGAVSTKLALTVNPAPVAAISVSASTIAFGNTMVNSIVSQSLTLTSTGTAPLTITAATLSGAGFSASGSTFPVTLNPGQTTTLAISYNPLTAGPANGTITVANNSAATPSVATNLTGTGLAAVSALTCGSSAGIGPASIFCTATLNVAAPPGGQSVILSSNNAAVTVPSTVTIPPGATSAAFAATLSSVTSNQVALLTASANGVARSFSLQDTAAIPTLTASTASLVFGNVAVNSAASVSLTLTSSGNAPLTISAATISGAGFSASGVSFPVTLNPGQSATLTVSFNPVAAGPANGTITIANNSSATPSLAISASGAGLAGLSALSCSSSSAVGPASVPCTATLNVAAPPGGQSLTLSSSNAAVIVPSSVTIPAGMTSAAFASTLSSVTSDQVAVLTACANGVARSFSLQDTAAIPTLTASTTSLVFGNVAVNNSASVSLTLTSSGNAPLTISAATISGAGFSASGVSFPVTLNPGQSATLTLSFNPVAAGPANGAIAIANNSSATPSLVISLGGTGLAALSSLSCASSSAIGPASVPCSATLNVAAPPGGQSVTLSSTNAAVTVPSTVTIPPGATSAAFAATLSCVSSNQAAVLTALANAASQSFALQDTAAIPTLAVSTTSLLFGNVAVNSAASVSLTLTSSGTAPVTATSASLTGTGFTISGVTFPVTLNPGQSFTLTVLFNPSVADAAAGLLTISSNSSSGPSTIVSLSGTGVYSNNGKTYYLAPRANGGSDANSGLAPNEPWLTPNHSLRCGDVIVAAASAAYNSDNFNSGQWGTVSCPAGNNVAWLQCATFDGCKINSTRYGIYVDRSYWGVQGWEVTVAAPGTGFCFGAAPRWGSPTEVHHIVFANNVANGCQSGGFVTFNIDSTTSVDYVSIVGNVAYNASQSNAHCFSGISIYQPVQSDSAPGTHIYISGNFSFGNFDPSYCNGTLPTDGEGIILDTFDGDQGGMPTPYAAQALVENNILVANGGRGFEVQNNAAASQHSTIYSRYNTLWGNNLDTNQVDPLCGEFLILTAYGTNAYANLVAASKSAGCGGYPLTDFWTYQGDSSDSVYNNFAYAMGAQNSSSSESGSFTYAASNITAQSSLFANAAAPAAPNCTGTANVPACMSNVITSFTPTTPAAAGYGYQAPGSAPISDPLFPKWLCSVNIPAGLTTMGCLP